MEKQHTTAIRRNESLHWQANAAITAQNDQTAIVEALRQYDANNGDRYHGKAYIDIMGVSYLVDIDSTVQSSALGMRIFIHGGDNLLYTIQIVKIGSLWLPAHTGGKYDTANYSDPGATVDLKGNINRREYIGGKSLPSPQAWVSFLLLCVVDIVPGTQPHGFSLEGVG